MPTIALIANKADIATGNISGANFVCAMVCAFPSAPTTLVDSVGNVMTPLTDVPEGSNHVRLFYAKNATTSASYGLTAPSGSFGMAWSAFSNVDPTAPFDQQNGSASTSPGSITPGQNGEVLITGMRVSSGAGNTIASVNSSFNMTDNVAGGTNYGHAMAYQIQTTATTRNLTWSVSSASFGSVVASFKPLTTVTLSVADATVALGNQNVGLTQANTLSMANAALALSADNTALAQANILAVAATTMALSTQSPSLTQSNVLAIANSLVALTTDSVALTQANVLALANALVALSEESPAITQANVLAVTSALVALVAESPALTQGHVLAVANSLIAFVAQSPALTQANVLAVVDALVGLAIQSPNVIPDGPGSLFVSIGDVRDISPSASVRDGSPSMTVRMLELRPRVRQVDLTPLVRDLS